MVVLQETIGREALIALSNQYDSVADALMELIDNPFDYRKGRHLTVDIRLNKSRDEIVVLDTGGQGMGAADLRDWISWGTGHEHLTTDIGQWHVGGKLAAIYLAEALEIIVRRSESNEILRFYDAHWGSRTVLLFTSPEILEQRQLPKLLSEVEANAGFTYVRLRGLKPRRYEAGILKAKLSNTYRTLLLQGHCTIKVDGVQVDPLDIPFAPSYVDRAVDIPSRKLEGGVTVKGRLWITDREKFKIGRGVGLKAGVRTVFNGRLITDGEEFTHYLAGRGSLQRLVGEIEINHLRPNTTKDGWDRDSHGWIAVQEFMHEQMQPLVTFLNSLNEGNSVSRQQRKRAENVRHSVEATLKRIQFYHSSSPGSLPGGDGVAPGGRAKAQARSGSPEPSETSRSRGEVRNRTEPPKTR
ncbi:MAG: hypothetical protein EXR43_03445 [Dehalococcoidia bacterium]|nr:hypothetical protein [Dehalococcoidia bacterium]